MISRQRPATRRNPRLWCGLTSWYSNPSQHHNCATRGGHVVWPVFCRSDKLALLVNRPMIFWRRIDRASNDDNNGDFCLFRGQVHPLFQRWTSWRPFFKKMLENAEFLLPFSIFTFVCPPSSNHPELSTFNIFVSMCELY
jgi:hypothetical protein